MLKGPACLQLENLYHLDTILIVLANNECLIGVGIFVGHFSLILPKPSKLP